MDQLYSMVFICKECQYKILGFKSLTEQAIKHNQINDLEQPGSQSGHHS